jgi:Ca2+-transporting ATPase
MAEAGLRVIASAFRELSGVVENPEERESEMTFLGLAGMMDAPREEAIEAVRVCKEISIKPVMITGDHKLTAVAIAKEVGIYHEGDMVLTGEELAAITEEEFEPMVDRVSVYARVAPMDKLKIVRAWKKRGAVVAMTGDGVNDAPALKHADIGIAMGITGTEVAKEAADMVLADDNFATIIRAIERGRWIYDNIKKYLTYLLRTNLIEVVVLGGIVIVKGPEYLPLLPATILFINLITDGLPALALGIAPSEPDVMKRPPRDPKESFFSADVRIYIFLALLLESPLFFYLFLRNPDLTSARTDLFFLFVFIELVIALNFTSLRFSILRTPPHRWLVISVVASMVITVVLTLSPSLRGSFGIAIPQTKTFLMIVFVGLFITLSIEAVKVFLRKRPHD